MTTPSLAPTEGSRRRRLSLLGLTTVALGAAVLLLVASAGGTLTGSTFESGDGNLAVDTAGLHDWNSPIQAITCPSTPGAGTNCGTDLIRSGDDNALGQGAKEDIPVPAVVTGSIPPNKSDLSRFYVNQEKAGGSDFLYLAWERTNVLGSANMDFEFNQDATPSGNGVTPVRTPGDMLIRFDFTGGGSIPTLSLVRWLTSANATASDCFKNNSLPCWGVTTAQGDMLDGLDDQQINLSSAGFAEGAVNSVTVHDANPPPAAGSDLLANTFGEAGINLTAANVFPPGTCESFGAAFLKSRSSAAFDAELKDFIAPIAVNIRNCGGVNIHKQDDLGAPLAGAVFTLFIDNAPTDGSPPHGAEDTATSFTCTTDASGNCTMGTNIPFGDYWAVETTGVPNHDLAPDQSFTLSTSTPDLTISLTFVDPRQPGAILITKTAKNHSLGAGQHPLAGAVFDVTDSNGNSVGGGTTDANGQVCVGNLALGATYTVTEASAPTGYSIDTPSKPVTISGSATCGSGHEDPVTFTDTPLSDVSVTFTSNAGSGVTTGEINCGAGAISLPDGTSTLVLDDKAPGTYNCTITIDP